MGTVNRVRIDLLLGKALSLPGMHVAALAALLGTAGCDLIGLHDKVTLSGEVSRDGEAVPYVRVFLQGTQDGEYWFGVVETNWSGEFSVELGDGVCPERASIDRQDSLRRGLTTVTGPITLEIDDCSDTRLSFDFYTVWYERLSIYVGASDPDTLEIDVGDEVFLLGRFHVSRAPTPGARHQDSIENWIWSGENPSWASDGDGVACLGCNNTWIAVPPLRGVQPGSMVVRAFMTAWVDTLFADTLVVIVRDTTTS